MATKAERIQELIAATTAWRAKRLQELDDKVTLSKRILQGRTGSERLANGTVTSATALVADEIEDFLREE